MGGERGKGANKIINKDITPPKVKKRSDISFKYSKIYLLQLLQYFF
ncbi:MAG: hypothetical protein XD96_1535 [Petrotoga mobilis]|nr:MAG: hypothetical protein XD96_1535 [Petrotoga mobilis]